MASVILAIFLWSSLGVVIKLSGMTVTVLMFYAALISALTTGIIILLKKDLWREITFKSVLPLFVLAPVSLVNTFTFFYAYKNTSIANAVLTHYTAPVMVAFLAPLILKERFSLTTIIAALIASAGLWIMLGVSPEEFYRAVGAGDRDSLGIISGLLSGLAYAMLIILIRKLAPQYHPVILTFFQNTLITLMLLPFSGTTADIMKGLWAFLIMGIVHSTLAPVLYFYGMKTVTAIRGGLIGYLEPFFSIILGMVFLKELIDIKTVIGGILILLSGYITIKNK
ncbi:MAG: DMT family transporter [Thermodesulfovibrionales bacterium]|nr:DMT family transporter [Thermodesulfovibrionales bacterium]